MRSILITIVIFLTSINVWAQQEGSRAAVAASQEIASNKEITTELSDNEKGEKEKAKEVVKPRLVNRETDEFRRLRLEGFEELYNMNYKGAHVSFNKMIELLPDYPAGYFYQATGFWLDLLNSNRRLQASLYNSESFYAKTEDKVDPKTDKEFRALIKTAQEKAEAAIKLNPKDPEALYYLGAIHGLIASYEATVTRSFLSALRNGSKSVDLHKKVVEIEPGFADAYLTIGTYDYIVGSLPLPVKVFAALGGFRGSKSRGLEELTMVTERGLYARDDARVVLLALYSREKRHEDSLKILEELSTKYPRNYLFKIERAATLVKLDRAAESYKIFDELLKTKEADRVADLVHYQYGEVLAAQGHNEEALKHFSAIFGISNASSELVTRSHLRTGQLLDLLARRNEALAEYQVVLKRENVFDSHEQAKKYLKEPYKNS